MIEIPFKGITHLPDAFRLLDMDRLTRMFLAREVPSVARVLGADIQGVYGERRRLTAIKEFVLSKPDQEIRPPVCPGHALTGLRWQKTARGQKIHVYTADEVPVSFRNYISSALAYLEAQTRLARFQMVTDPSQANVVNLYRPYDGRGKTLGVTSYIDQDNDDLEVIDRPVVILMDSSENWRLDIDYFRTVYLHELLHALGIGHAPVRGNLMYATYLGNMLFFGPWDSEQVDDRYILTRQAA